MQEHKLSAHPEHKFLEEAAGQVTSTEELKDGFPELWAHLQECEQCAVAFAELLRIAHEEGHREGHAEEAQMRRAVVMTAIAGVLAVALLAGGLFFRQRRTEAAAVNHVYAQVSPAVANIEVQSAGVKGTGFVFDQNGYLLTNHHVIKDAQNHQDIVVQLSDLGQVPSKLVGADLATDLAVLKVDAPLDRLTVASFGNSEAVKVGDLAIAIGNPFGLGHSLTVGHISAVGRRLLSDDPYTPLIEGVLQTDASINPGNSGGPLLNARGEVIGINTRIQSPTRASAGIGFAIPSHTARWVAQEIIHQGYVRRPFLGAAGRPLDVTLARDLGLPIDQGLLVQQIHLDSPAAMIGLKAGDSPIRTTSGQVKWGADILLSFAGQPVRNQEDLNKLVAQHEVGDNVELEILRNGQRMTLEVALTQHPPPEPLGGK